MSSSCLRVGWSTNGKLSVSLPPALMPASRRYSPVGRHSPHLQEVRIGIDPDQGPPTLATSVHVPSHHLHSHPPLPQKQQQGRLGLGVRGGGHRLVMDVCLSPHGRAGTGEMARRSQGASARTPGCEARGTGKAVRTRSSEPTVLVDHHSGLDR